MYALTHKISYEHIDMRCMGGMLTGLENLRTKDENYIA